MIITATVKVSNGNKFKKHNFVELGIFVEDCGTSVLSVKNWP